MLRQEFLEDMFDTLENNKFVTIKSQIKDIQFYINYQYKMFYYAYEYDSSIAYYFSEEILLATLCTHL